MKRTTTTLALAFALLASACGEATSLDTTDSANGADNTENLVNESVEENGLTEVTEAAEIDCSPFEGRWVGTEEFGSEDDEGGIYRPVLTLDADAESSFASSDTIELFASYECTIRGIELDGGQVVEFIDDDTLQFGRATLVRAD